jgi:plastocyanin
MASVQRLRPDVRRLVQRLGYAVATAIVAVIVATGGLGVPGSRAADATVSIVDFAFEPADLTVVAGTTITWTVTRAAEPHTVTALEPADAFEGSPLLRSGDTFSVTVTAPGTIRYLCAIHPEDMRGMLVVLAQASASPAGTQPASPTATQTATPTEPLLPASTPTASGLPSGEGAGPLGAVPLIALLAIAGAVALGALLVARAVRRRV